MPDSAPPSATRNAPRKSTQNAPRSARRRGPAVVVWVIAALALALLVLPLVAILLSAPWARMPVLLVAPETLQALGLSVLTAVISTALNSTAQRGFSLELSFALNPPTGRLIRG